MKPVRIACIGLGYWGQTLAERVVRSGAGSIVCGYAATASSRTQFSKRFGCRISASFDEILLDPEIEAVMLATPNGVHAEQIARAARAGKHIFVEKPIAVTVEDAIAAWRACEERGVVLAVGHQSRREPGIRALKSLIEKGELGDVVGVEANISTDTGLMQPEGAWRTRSAECPGGPLIQTGIHHIDTLHYLLGPIRAVSGIQRNRLVRGGLDDSAVTLLDFESGILGTLTCQYSSARVADIRLIGTRAVGVNDRQRGLELRKDTRERPFSQVIELKKTDPVAEEVLEFLQCVRTGAAPEVGGAEATLALAVVLAAVQSSKEGGLVRVAAVR